MEEKGKDRRRRIDHHHANFGRTGKVSREKGYLVRVSDIRVKFWADKSGNTPPPLIPIFPYSKLKGVDLFF